MAYLTRMDTIYNIFSVANFIALNLKIQRLLT
jgi:hypothetical protein